MRYLSQPAKGMLCLTIALFFSFGGCSLQTVIKDAPTLGKQGRASLYLQPLPQEMHSLTFVLDGLAVVAKDGTKTSLLSSPITIKGREFIGIQKFLTAGILTPGNYQGISILIAEASITELTVAPTISTA